MATETTVTELKINKLSKAQYDSIQNPSDTELFLVPDVVDSSPTSGSSNYVTSGGVFAALEDKIDKSNTAGLVKNDGTIDTNTYLTTQVQSDWNETDTADPAYIANKPTIPNAVSGTNDGTNWTSLTIGDTTKAIPSGGGGGLSDYDFTHIPNTTVSTSTTITFAADTRGSQMVSTAANLAVTFAVENLSDNYLWIKNTGSSDIDITINDVTQNSTSVSNIYVPDDGITVPAGKVCEIGIVVNADGAFITSRSDLSL